MVNATRKARQGAVGDCCGLQPWLIVFENSDTALQEGQGYGVHWLFLPLPVKRFGLRTPLHF